VPFYLIGDASSPCDFHLDGCDFYDIRRQLETGFRFAQLCPKRHYARKNIGYLLAMRAGAESILETDDDNIPEPGFWEDRPKSLRVKNVRNAGWVNVYRYFSEAKIWPRGFPLETVNSTVTPYASLPKSEVSCPIQQGLADENPDVDAIYRLLLPLPQRFHRNRRVALGPASWCPFNSQNTLWWSETFPLLYLPATCSFRMTDLWRSLIAQRITSENGWYVLFHEPTVRQERNDHDLLRDLQDEIPGYLNASKVAATLSTLEIRPGMQSHFDNLRRCYEALIRMSLFDPREAELLEAWLEDVSPIWERISVASNKRADLGSRA
jgi:hypothetical protein